MRFISKENLSKLVKYIEQNNLAGVLITDNEDRRDVSLKYISGHPMDGNLIVTRTGKVYLNVWDLILAKKEGEADYIYSFDECSMYELFRRVIDQEKLKGNLTFEVSSSFSVSIKDHLEEVTGVKLIYKNSDSFFNLLNGMRTIKSEEELKILRQGCEITTVLIDKIGGFIGSNKEIKEYDLAFYLLKEAKAMGAQKESFEFLTANKKRSWGIHAYPATSNQPLNYRGLALIDFGILYQGYCTDVTVPMAFGPITSEEKIIVETVIKAHDEAIKAIKPGVFNYEVSEVAVGIINDRGYEMPHGLGHGIGLEVHEFPRINSKPRDPQVAKNWKPVKLEENMVFTIEPGIYAESIGGSRLEDDVVVTKNGCDVLTQSKFYHFKENYID